MEKYEKLSRNSCYLEHWALQPYQTFSLVSPKNLEGNCFKISYTSSLKNKNSAEGYVLTAKALFPRITLLVSPYHFLTLVHVHHSQQTTQVLLRQQHNISLF